MTSEERRNAIRKLSMTQKVELAQKEAYAELIEERSRMGETLVLNRNGLNVEVPAVELLPDAQRIKQEVESILSLVSLNGHAKTVAR
jgi:hypothetical protein